MTNASAHNADRHAAGDYQLYARHGWRGRIRAKKKVSGWISGQPTAKPPAEIQPDTFSLGDRDPLALAEGPGVELVRDRAAARTWYVPAEQIYLKHITSLQDKVASPLSPMGLKWRFAASRTLGLLELNPQLEAAGLRVAPILLAARRTQGLTAEELLITQAIEGEPYATIVRESPDIARIEQLAALIGQRLAQLHDAGFIHGDFAPGNLLVLPGDSDVVLLDNERTRRIAGSNAATEQRKNLVQIAFRLLLRRGYQPIKPLLAAYDQHRPRDAAAMRRDRVLVLRETRRRVAEFMASASQTQLDHLRLTPGSAAERWPKR